MANLRRRLANLPALVIFEAASRAQNFSRAAEELGVTRVSVSRQIADLEAALGAKLFHRGHRRVTLTQAGALLKSSVVPALTGIAETLDRIQRDSSDQRLSVTTTTAFATYWLMPRLGDFSARYPDVELNLVVSDRYLDLEAERVDIAIRYSDVGVPETGSTGLCQEYLYPVYSPRYRKRSPMRTSEDLLDEQLLHLSGSYRPQARWPHWFDRMGLAAPQESAGVVVNTYITMLQAAIEGQGVALAGSPLINRYIADGSLLTIAGIAPLPRDTYYLIDRTEDRADARLFATWMAEQIGRGSALLPEAPAAQG
ncbi:MAG: LysR substrate-binding domain-containing protein [Kiloniellales bacterium]